MYIYKRVSPSLGIPNYFALRTIQSISASLPYFFESQAFAFKKWPFPRKPRWADKGDGWADLRMRFMRGPSWKKKKRLAQGPNACSCWFQDSHMSFAQANPMPWIQRLFGLLVAELHGEPGLWRFPNLSSHVIQLCAHELSNSCWAKVRPAWRLAIGRCVWFSKDDVI